ncbi:DUF262 domain-containing protein [Terrisporobacter hibernicus]|uniref:DUF262 domain-containing protein n=1 Tax=Terrisporobacter hibernicus TaxID=2813371 RepID=A0AAX2ZDF8_9FIRM|nr:DUF262 domain-containing protein [Terrisporobacter hibernicus]UEL46437.1 DUF262 domain-containing protein [Terrisporobacter hibernicus]
MEYTKATIKDLIMKSQENELLLPNFQREYVWERPDNQKELLVSILYDIPVGSLLILNGESGYFATKELCVRQPFEERKRDSTLYLLDGQQRLSTIKSMFIDFFDKPDAWESTFNSLYPKLRTRWFLRIIPKENESDIFGWKKLKFDSLQLLNYTPSEISNFVEYKVLNKNDYDKWYHPEYKKDQWYENNDVKVSARKNIISNQAAMDGKVALYSIIMKTGEKESSTLHYKTLTKIADARIAELMSEVEDKKLDIRDVIPDYSDDEEISELWNSLKIDWITDIIKFLNKINEKEIPIIQLVKEEMSRAIYTFERVNKGGTALSTYDLVVAKAAHNQGLESLTDRILKKINKEMYIPNSITNGLYSINSNKWTAKNMELNKDNELCNFTKNQYLNLLSIFSYFEYENGIDQITLEYIKKNKILDINYEKINTNTNITIESLLRACALLQYRCGIIKESKLPYELMILPIAYILRNDEYWNDHRVINKIEYWYWSSLFGGSYRANQNEQCIEDIKQLHTFITTDKNPFKNREKNVLNAGEYSDLNTLIYKSLSCKIPNAMYDGILQYILSKQPKDFLEESLILNAWDIAAGKTYKSQNKNKEIKLEVQDHHICPLGGATKIGQSSKDIRSKQGFILNSPLNRTLITNISNNIISDKNESEYFKYVGQLSIYGHCIPSPIHINYNKKEDESDEQYYERVVTSRYNEILRDMKQELNNLKYV